MLVLNELNVVIDERDTHMTSLRMDAVQAQAYRSVALRYLRERANRTRILKDYVMSAEPYHLM